MDIKNLKNRTDKKHYAQELLMHQISIALGYWQENLTEDDVKKLGQDGIAEINQLMTEQADRVAKLLGYEKAWVS